MTDSTTTLTRRGTIRAASLATGGLMLGGLAFAGPAGAQRATTHVNISDTITFEKEFNPCTNEDIHAETTLYFVIQDAPDDDHINIKFTAHGEGVGGTTGIVYQWTDNFNFTLNHRGAETETVVAGPLNLLSRGPADNLRLFGQIHITINANGEPTAFRFVPFDATCTG